MIDFDAIKKGIHAAGGYMNVADRMEPPVSRQCVWQWAHNTPVPPLRCKHLARVTGLKLHVIRPDIFPEDLWNVD